MSYVVCVVCMYIISKFISLYQCFCSFSFSSLLFLFFSCFSFLVFCFFPSLVFLSCVSFCFLIYSSCFFLSFFVFFLFSCGFFLISLWFCAERRGKFSLQTKPSRLKTKKMHGK